MLFPSDGIGEATRTRDEEPSFHQFPQIPLLTVLTVSIALRRFEEDGFQMWSTGFHFELSEL
jgi:hypothetical protein